MVLLSQQSVAKASPTTKIRCAVLSLAMVDALGGPAEFKTRFSFPRIDNMISNRTFNLTKGVWTDDTSMALCLARSITSTRKFSLPDQLNRYLAWYRHGELSCTGVCFDIGNTISAALHIWELTPSSDEEEGQVQALEEIRQQLGHESCRGNGSLMRVLPVGLTYHHSEQTAVEYARQSSVTTHPNSMCVDACEVYTRTVVRTLAAALCPDRNYTKLDLLREMTEEFGIKDKDLRKALCLPSAMPSGTEDVDCYYRTHHPLLCVTPKPSSSQRNHPLHLLPSAAALPSSGYVLHTLFAALYAFFVTETFEDGAVLVVNMGNDADTVGAIYGGLAGCWYGHEDFWSPRGKQWLADLKKKDVLEEVIAELVEFAQHSD